MGCCSSRSFDSPASRVTRWRSTGIVALRDARLKEVPNEVLQVGNSLRTLDLTNNRLGSQILHVAICSISIQWTDHKDKKYFHNNLQH
uniref:Uncharacterized protein n=1 Tax=Arundo donax TaxID=35708 RepID=A0A0A9FXR2_ARUDO